VWQSQKWIFTASAVCMNSVYTLLKFSSRMVSRRIRVAVWFIVNYYWNRFCSQSFQYVLSLHCAK